MMAYFHGTKKKAKQLQIKKNNFIEIYGSINFLKKKLRKHQYLKIITKKIKINISKNLILVF